MPLPPMNRCQICGDILFHDSDFFFSDPCQHFCLTVNGPGMTDSYDANGPDIVHVSI